jgi:hypothetical protein
MLVHTGSPRALGVHGFIACRWSIDSAGRLACHWEADKTGGGRKPGVGDHTPERFADHEPSRNANNGGFSAFGPAALNWKAVKRLIALT